MTFPWLWSLSGGYPAKGIKKHHSKVFSTFACGGGSTMGYKLAGYDVIGANDIDPDMMEIYEQNHHPKHTFLEGIDQFNKRKDLPKELYDLDVLDGSPPCSSFSIAGAREKNWGKKRKFREGQAEQVIDDLFFRFIETAEKLKPKIIIAENVKGMLIGHARGYVVQIDEAFRKAGYEPQLFLLNAATMGVPQKRERIFFLCRRIDLDLPPIRMEFSEKPILWGEVADRFKGTPHRQIRPKELVLWRQTQPGQNYSKAHGRGSYFNHVRLSRRKTCNTIASASAYMIGHSDNPWELNERELAAVQTFPQDFDYRGQGVGYVIGMSVPPVMMAQVSRQVYLQWISKL